ncbi:MAG TPA: hypothetical protein DHM37_07110 [Candidatus Cloacimonas sp.]|jgi:anaerobic magnesium-protoporphyrin IX monomethyl ester cyclase|nr:hypothetical protein [Candidatus Cloacimonadota bacterium]HCX73468.1 hypothetical protein [Candidatus Cloacimonas sp.]
MKKLLLAAINTRYTHTNLAIRYLRNYNLDLNYHIELLEVSINQQRQEILAAIASHKPDFLALSVYIWNSNLWRMLISDIKAVLPDCILILGGPEAGYNAEKWLQEFPEIDYIVQGDGEESLRYILTQKPDEKIILKQNPPFEKIPFPYNKEDFPAIKNKYIYYESSRGCPFHCSYCLSSRKDKSLQYRNWTQVQKELKFLLQFKPRIIKFVDRTFNAKPEWARQIWKYLLSKDVPTKFHFELHPNLLQTEDFEILEKAPKDKFQFELGIQTTNQRTLNAINRPQPYDRQKVLRLIEMKKFHIHVDLIAGLPWEDIVSFQKSFNEIHNLGAEHFQMGFLKVLPGTQMAASSREFQLACQRFAPYKILQNRWLSYTELNLLEQIESVQNLLYNSGNFSTFLQYALPYFSSPFTFYRNLATSWQKLASIPRKWKKLAALLLKFSQTELTEHQDLLLDALRWDWCKLASGHYYPDFLNSSKFQKAKKEGFSFLKNNEQIQLKDLRRAIFFQKESTEFTKCEADEIVCFLPSGSIHKIYK